MVSVRVGEILKIKAFHIISFCPYSLPALPPATLTLNYIYF